MKIVVLISANAEWRSVRALFPLAGLRVSPFGEWFESDEFSFPLVYFHGGWGKISAGATTQYAISFFHPDLLINLGTCGGFEGRIQAGAVILVDRTIVYDIFEQMADADGAVAHYTTEIDLSWLKGPLPASVQRGLLLSGDRDIMVEDIPMLVERYDAVAADWESGAIAWVANKNRVRCLILRGVTDLVGSTGGEAYGNLELFHQRTDQIMKQLFSQLDAWIRLCDNP